MPDYGYIIIHIFGNVNTKQQNFKFFYFLNVVFCGFILKKFANYVKFVVFCREKSYNLNMQVYFDVHTHSVSSGHHTKDTITDLAKKAAEIGLKYLCITEHAPAMIGTTNASYFRNLRYAPKERFGVKIIYGAELNVINQNGDVDLDGDVLSCLDFSIASLHKDVFKPSSESADTAAIINAMKNPFVNVVGHPDDPTFSLNAHALTDAAKETSTALELNSAGISKSGYREPNIPFLVEMLYLCKRKGVYIVLGSDSHGKDRIADFDDSIKILKAIDFPDELVLNYDIQLFKKFIGDKRCKI